MSAFSLDFVDEVVHKCIQLYKSSPQFGKPVEEEWTVLSCIIQLNTNTRNLKVVSLGTGSKCIGASKMSPEGDRLNDSHAEVFARRGFMLYIYDNIEKAVSMKPKEETIFEKLNGRFKMKNNLEFIFYSSQMPCGDASIMPKLINEDQGDIVGSNKRSHEDEVIDINVKKLKTDFGDIHRTGAKCLPHSEQDPKETGINYHLLGKVRIKPGRGDRTLSVSCSDKIARWVHVGIQGALLDMLLAEPIYIKHFIFGSGVPYSKESLTRALLDRDSNNIEQSELQLVPHIYQTTVCFDHIKSERRLRPAPGSIVFVNCGILEVGVHGKRLGITKKNAHLKSSSLHISKYKIYQRFLNLLEKNSDLKEKLVDCDLSTIPYNEMKKKSQRYYKHWYNIRDTFFKTWTIKPDMWSFCVNPIN